MRATLAALLFACLPLLAVGQMADDQVSSDYLSSLKVAGANGASIALGGALGRHSTGSVLGVDSIPNWSSNFYEPGIIDSFGDLQFNWAYTMVGHAPFGQGHSSDWDGESTFIGAPIVPVNIDLRNFDGSPRFVNGIRMYLDATQFVKPVLQSPIFSLSRYSSSGTPTQFTDALMRAEFFKKSDDDWHTYLVPRVAPARTMVLIRGTYRFATAPDGSLLFVLVDPTTFLNEFFPPPSLTGPDNASVIGQAESAHDITTRDISTFLFPNTFLNVGGGFLVFGFHNYDIEAGGQDNGFRERRYVLNYSSYITPGVFIGDPVLDVATLSHELSETFNDPFVNNATPWWLSPNGNCQNNLETGDVIEGLPNEIFPITLHGNTYHPQNEALLQWFADQTPSSAIHGAYSYPNENVLTSGSVPQLPGCPAPATTASN